MILKKLSKAFQCTYQVRQATAASPAKFGEYFVSKRGNYVKDTGIDSSFNCQLQMGVLLLHPLMFSK